MKILVELPEWQYKEIKGDKGISEGVMINALCAIRFGKLVEQESRKGKWLAIRTKEGTHEMTCSRCGYVRVELINKCITEEDALAHLKDSIDENKFCLNCGADMRGEE